MFAAPNDGLAREVSAGQACINPGDARRKRFETGRPASFLAMPLMSENGDVAAATRDTLAPASLLCEHVAAATRPAKWQVLLPWRRTGWTRATSEREGTKVTARTSGWALTLFGC